MSGHPYSSSPLDRPLAVTFFYTAGAWEKDEYIVTLRDLAPHIKKANKSKKQLLPWLKLAQFGDVRKPNDKNPPDKWSFRHNENVLAITGVEADYDDGVTTIFDALAILRASNLAGVVYSSPSHTEDVPRWRVLCPLSEDYPPSDRTRFLERLNGIFGGSLSGESFTLSQSYYFGSVKGNPSHCVETIEGDYLDLRSDLDAGAIGKPKTEYRPIDAPLPDRRADKSRYVEAVIKNALSKLSRAPDGQKHYVLREQSKLVGGFLHVGSFTIDEMAAIMVDALPNSVVDRKAALSTAKSGLELGATLPLEIPQLQYMQPEPPLANEDDYEPSGHAEPNGHTTITADEWEALEASSGHVVLSDGRPSILIQAGRVDLLATEAEAAIRHSNVEVYQRGRELVRPAQQEVPASKGRMTISAGMAKISHPGMIDLLSQAADWKRFDARRKREVAADPPGIVADVILARVGQWKLPSVAGVITTPTLRPDGTILHQAGYDPVTRLYQVVDPNLIPAYIPDRPTIQDARDALGILDALVDEFPFVSDADRSVALSAMITPIVRGAVTVAPLHAIRASTAGTGKSYLADTASAIATGRPCPVVAVSPKPEETESRLIGLLLAAFPLISLDNVNGELGGDLLCQAVERPTVRVRRLGASDIFEIESRATFYATGNNLRVKGDMTRRTVISNLDAGVERPEDRQFTHSPVEDVISDRGKYVAACLIIVRAYIVAGKPGMLPKLASFEEWSDLVRSPLVWLGRADPVDTTEQAREDDPDLIPLRNFVISWPTDQFGTASKTVKEMIDLANSKPDSVMGEPTDFIAPEFREALIDVAGFRGNIDGRKLGYWLRGIEGRIINGLRVKKGKMDAHAKSVTWRVM